MTVCNIAVIATTIASVFLLTENDNYICFKLGFFPCFGGNWEKRRVFWIGNGAEYQTLVIGKKGPVRTSIVRTSEQSDKRLQLITVLDLGSAFTAFLGPTASTKNESHASFTECQKVSKLTIFYLFTFGNDKH